MTHWKNEVPWTKKVMALGTKRKGVAAFRQAGRGLMPGV